MAAAVGVAIGAMVQGEEAPKPAGIESAKEGYSELKAATTQSNSWQQLAVPSSKELGATVEFAPTLPPAPSSTSTAPDQRSKASSNPSKNWLVDAMMKPKGQEKETIDLLRSRSNQQDLRRRDEETLEVGTNQDDRARTTTIEAKASSAPSSLSAMAIKDAAVANNPLERYLSDWMTPRDLAILRPDSAIDAGPARDLDQQLASGFAAEHDRLGPIPKTEGGGGATSAAVENPYLALFADPPAQAARTYSSSVANAFPRSTPPPAATMAPTQAAPASPALINSAAAEHERARDEAKYFKQLKRF